jgi:hypothetical protein
MPRLSQLSSVPTEALVEELHKRFAAIEKAKALLFGSSAVSNTSTPASGRQHVPSKRKRGGTSAYAKEVSSLVQKIRHAKDRKESTTALERKLARVRASHKG